MHGILDKMHQMRLNGMARAFQHTLDGGRNERYTADEMLTHIIESEWDERHNQKLDRSLKDARFRYKASVETLNFDDNLLDKNQLTRLVHDAHRIEMKGESLRRKRLNRTDEINALEEQ